MSIALIASFLLLGACTGFAAGLPGIGGGMLLVSFITMLLYVLAAYMMWRGLVSSFGRSA